MSFEEIYLLKHFGSQNPTLKDDVAEIGLGELLADEYIEPEQFEAASALIAQETNATFQPYQEALPWLVQNQLMSEDEAEIYGYLLIAMAWMRVRDVVTEDDFTRFVQDCAFTQGDFNIHTIITCLVSPDKQADARLPGLLTEQPLVLLHAEGLINDAQLEHARSLLDSKPPTMHRNLGDIWQWLLWHDVLGKAAAQQAIHNLIQARRGNTPSVIARLKKLQSIAPVEIEAEITRLLALRKKAKRVMILTIVLVILALTVYKFLPTDAPQCNSEESVSTLAQLIAERRSTAIEENPMLVSVLSGDLNGEREVGYQRETRTRGCLVDLQSDGQSFPIGYVISPEEEGSNSFFFTAAPVGIHRGQFLCAAASTCTAINNRSLTRIGCRWPANTYISEYCSQAWT